MKRLVISIIVIAFLISPLPTYAQSTNTLLQQISELLKLVTSLQQQLANLEGKTTQTQSPALNLTRSLYIGLKGTDVTQLQTFLRSTGDFTYPEITGYYGSVTAQAVQRYQCREIQICSGTPTKNGYGVVGPQTRKTLARTKTASTNTPVIVTTITPTSPITPPITGGGGGGTSTFVPTVIPVTPVASGQCNAEKLAEILESASSPSDYVSVNCSITLPPSQNITKQIHLGPDASGTTFDCNNSTLNNKIALSVSSRYVSASDIRQTNNVTVRNCRMNSTFQVAAGISSSFVSDSSRTSGYTNFMRQIAPKNITFENVTFVGQGGLNGMYVQTGSTYVTLKNSTFEGNLRGVPLYLDAESGYHTITNNIFRVDTQNREQIAIDGSSDNAISNNTFSYSSNSTRPYDSGGVHIYRNCGENGIIRHNEPRRNTIESNTFSFVGSGSVTNIPGVWLGSRNNRDIEFCSDDSGYQFGSSVSNRDFATNNVVKNNTFVDVNEQDAIQNNDQNNIVTGNQFTFSVPADLTPEAPLFNGADPSTRGYRASEEVIVSTVVKNIGGKESGVFRARIRIEKDGKFHDAITFEEVSLAGGDSVVLSGAWTPSEPGNYVTNSVVNDPNTFVWFSSDVDQEYRSDQSIDKNFTVIN